MQTHPNTFTLEGGDAVQIRSTKSHLEGLGVRVDVSVDPAPQLDQYDLVHIFNVQYATHQVRQARNAKAQGKPLALSPIYWEMEHVAKINAQYPCYRNQTVQALAWVSWRIPFWGANLLLYRRRQRERSTARELIHLADQLLPNSYAELELIVRDFGILSARTKALVVVNGVELPHDNPVNPGVQTNLSLPNDFVLQVGHFYATKGQARLLRALSQHPEIPIVFVGGNLDSTYGQHCQALGQRRGNTFFLGKLPHDRLGPIYARAKVHALPSLRESPGLATLEAGSWGCNCVVSHHGPVAEYMGRDVWYCDPANLDSIRDAVFGALRSPRNEKFAQRIARDYSWRRAAEQTYEAYIQLTSSERHGRAV